ncbi:MAG: zinc metalloprotease, partial [Chitinophagaceae bacterium]
MRTFFVLCLLQVGLLSVAQERCASSAYIESLKSSSPAEAARMADAERFLQKDRTLFSENAKGATAPVIKIPVVVHVLYNNASQNISDALIKSQIDALNRDFRRQNADSVKTPARFKAIAADIEIEFYLATVDPKGRGTNGIIRKQTSVANWFNNDKIKSSAQGGDDPWESQNYLNIWVGKLISGAGYSSAPGSDGTKDGVVINYSAFGSSDANGYYNMGRTATHEIGHWLGLKHIWGDAQCGDDGISDTPPQGWYTQTCPTGFQSTCNNGELGDMYMNYMDYTPDACMNLFTEGQKRKMRTAFADGGPRASLLQSKGLKEPWLV